MTSERRAGQSPPPDLIKECVSKWDGERAQVASQGKSQLADSMVIESVLCGRIWSDVNEISSATLTKNNGALQTHLRACLAFHQLNILEEYDWRNFAPFLRNETISNLLYMEARGEDVSKIENHLIELGLSVEERDTLLHLNIDLPEHLSKKNDDENTYKYDILDKPEFQRIDGFWERRTLFHVSLGRIQTFIRENSTREDLPDPSTFKAMQYFSLKISKIFEKAVLSLIHDPGYLVSGKEGVGVLHTVEEHALISVPTESETGPNEPEKILGLLEQRIYAEAEGQGMDLGYLKLKCSKANEVGQEEPFFIQLKSDEKAKKSENLEAIFKKLRDEEQQIILGWGGKKPLQKRGSKAIYIDAVKLTNQIWGELGDRKSTQAFMRSIRITPHMNFVFGKAIGSVGKSLKMLHGGDDFLLTYDKHGIGKEDIVPELMGGVLEDLFGSGRWRVKRTPQQNGKKKITYHVVGKGFARPFWWWYDGESPSEDKDNTFLKALKRAKDKRRYWLESATRTDIQLHPNLDDSTLYDEEE